MIFYTAPRKHVEAVKAHRAEMVTELARKVAALEKIRPQLRPRSVDANVGFVMGLKYAIEVLEYDIKAQEDLDALMARATPSFQGEKH